MAGEVLQSIETWGDPVSANGSVLSDDTYVEGTPEPNDPEAPLALGRRYFGEDWYREEVARQREEEERERIHNEEAEAIRKLRDTDPWEYERQMGEFNLRLQGLTQEQIDKSNEPVPEEVAKSIFASFSACLRGMALKPTTTDSTNTRTTRGQSKRATLTLTEALVEEVSTSNATNGKVPQSKHDKTRQRKAYKGERASRRLANKPVEYGIFANRSMAPVPKDLQRNPLTRKRNPAGPRSKKSIAVEPAKHRGALKSGRGGTHRSRSTLEEGNLNDGELSQ